MEQHRFARIGEEAFAVEQVHFKKTKKRTPPRRVDPFVSLAGVGPVLVTAPHAVRWVRGGKLHVSAEFTGSYAYLLHEKTGAHALAVKKLYGGDPMSDEPCLFKERVAAVVRDENVEYLLDLAGAPRASDFDVELVLPPAPLPARERRMVAALCEALGAEGLHDFTKRTEGEDERRAVARVARRTLGIGALGIEINRRYRAPNRNGEDYARLFRALAATVETLAGAERTAG